MNTERGIVTEMTEIKTGETRAGGTWAKQIVAIEQGGRYPVTLAFEFNPEKQTDFAALQVGDEVEIGYYADSFKTKDGGYLSTLKGNRLTVLREAPRKQSAAAPVAAQQEAPPAAEPAAKRTVSRTAAPVPAPAADGEAEQDDLPF